MKSIFLTALLFTALPLTVLAQEAIQVGEEFVLCAKGPGKDIRGTPHVAWGKDGYLVVWREGWNGVGGQARIHAVRVDNQGKILDPQSIEIASCREGFQELPRVAFGSGIFLVVWQDFRNGKDHDVLGVRITPDGKVLDSPPLALAAGPRNQAVPDVTSDGKDFLVAWHTAEGETNNFLIRVLRVGADGSFGSPTEIKSPWAKAACTPRLAWDGTNFRLVYLAQSLLSIRLKPDGTFPEKEKIEVLRQHLGSGIKFAHTAAAAPGKGLLVVHSRSQPDYWGWGGPGATICSWLDMDGKKDTSMPREESPQTKLANWLDFGRDKKDGCPWPFGQSAAVWNGKQFIVVWQRYHIRQSVMLENCDLYVSAVEGWKPHTAAIPVAVSELEEKNPALACDDSGNLLCIYEKHARDGAIAIVGRLLKSR